MKWRKLGRVFNPNEHQLPGNCFGFAQAPQALVCDDFVRIYFSTRARDAAGGKFCSHVAFVDLPHDLSRPLRVADKTVIELGALGSFDEHGIFPMNVVRDGGRILAYTCGWNRRVSVSVDTAIGLAESTDGGLTFRKLGDGPVLGPTLHEPFLVGDPFVVREKDLFRMWYIFGTAWKRQRPEDPPDRVYKIGHATSHDGVTWKKDEGRRIIADRLDADEGQALPTVIRLGMRWHMWFCFRQAFDFRSNRDRGYRIGYAWSDDGQHWTRDDAAAGIDVTPGEWDSDMMCYPHVFACAGKVYLLYNGNEFGRHGFGAAVLE